MIEFERTQVFGWEGALRGMRNPHNSSDKSDSTYDTDGFPAIGMNDMDLMKKLVTAGSDHRKFMRQIFVSVDITAPLYWWKEYDTYKVGTCANSCSTMHTIHKKKFEINDFSYEKMTSFAREYLKNTIAVLNVLLESYNISGEINEWYSIIQLLPSSYNQRRTCTLTYENALAIYNARRNHKLSEWHEFCDWAVQELPYFAEITGECE